MSRRKTGRCEQTAIDNPIRVGSRANHLRECRLDRVLIHAVPKFRLSSLMSLGNPAFASSEVPWSSIVASATART